MATDWITALSLIVGAGALGRQAGSIHGMGVYLVLRSRHRSIEVRAEVEMGKACEPSTSSEGW